MRRPDDASATTTTAIASKNTYVFQYPSHEKVQESEFFVKKETCLEPCLKCPSSAGKIGFQT